MLGYYLMDPDTDVCHTEQPQISYSVDFIMAEQKSIGDPVLVLHGVLVLEGLQASSYKYLVRRGNIYYTMCYAMWVL